VDPTLPFVQDIAVWTGIAFVVFLLLAVVALTIVLFFLVD